jgi:RimJ/RimL family protein N-acetyltransferase
MGAPNEAGPVPVLSDGLVVLGPWSDGDLEWLATSCQDPEIERWTLVPSPYSIEDARCFVEVIALEAWASGTGLHLAIADLATGERLGAIGLDVHDEQSSVARLGYWLAPEARGRGAASCALELLSDWGFAERGLYRLELEILDGNEASSRVARRCGYQLEGILRSRELHRGRRRDVALYARIRD